MKKFYALFVVWIVAALLAFPMTAFADGSVMEKDVNGYHLKLTFAQPIKSGDNLFQLAITDNAGMPITGAEVKVEAMPVEGMGEMEMATAAPAVGVMTSNNNMAGMDTEEPTTGVMKPNAPAENADATTIMLEPASAAGEYAGTATFEHSGEWMFNVHFTINGQANSVEFPFDVARSLALNYGILAGFVAINATVITSAALLKRKAVRK